MQNDAEIWKITETLANGYSYESTQQELSNDYQHDRVQMFFRNLCILLLWTKVSSALKGLRVCMEMSKEPFCWRTRKIFYKRMSPIDEGELKLWKNVCTTRFFYVPSFKPIMLWIARKRLFYKKDYFSFIFLAKMYFWKLFKVEYS